MKRDPSTGLEATSATRADVHDAELAPVDAGALQRSQRLLYWRVLAPFALAMVALAFLTVAGFEVLSAVRAYVGGESLWSKSRAEAVQALKEYAAASGRAQDLERFERALAVPAGDHEARIELNKADPDFRIARAGFRRGGNREADIGGMIRLYRYFHDTELMRRALAAWVEGDRGIDELRATAAQIRADRTAGLPRGSDDAPQSAHIAALSAQLAVVEKEFSSSLGEASLRIERLLIAAVLATTTILIVAGLLLGRRSLVQRMKAERRLFGVQVERDAAEKVARSRVEFLSRLSHELRTPLNAILGFSQLLALDKEAPPTPEQARRLELIVQGGKQMLRLVEDVLDLSSIDSGSVGMRIEPVELQQVLATALGLVEPERERMQVRIDNRLGAAATFVTADARRLIQVFTNLLGNGCKYNARGGVLAIESLVVGEEAHVVFEDQGEGMTRAQVASLFQPFKRLPSHAGIPGTGMGLVVVRSLLAHMGGSIDVDSDPGKGSRFRVRLRRAPTAPSAAQT